MIQTDKNSEKILEIIKDYKNRNNKELETAMDFLKEMHDKKPVWMEMPFVWQSYMDLHLEELPIKLVPARTFNSVISELASYWEKGDFIVHFPGHPGVNPQLEAFLKKYES